jgi:RHS repeat-associated protein
MVASDFPGEGTVEYEYGADQKRRQRDDGTTVTCYNYDIGWSLLNEEDNAGTLTMTYVHDPMKAIGTVLADLGGTTPSTGTARYYSRDNIGSSRRLRDSGKGTLAQYEYEPYGRIYAQSGTTLADTFTGHSWDGVAGLYYAPYRYFDPMVARWLTRDPLGMVDGPNVYAYVKGNPVRYMDPHGAMTLGAYILMIIIIVLFAIAGGCFIKEGKECVDASKKLREKYGEDPYAECDEKYPDPVDDALDNDECRRKKYLEMLSSDEYKEWKDKCVKWAVGGIPAP